MFRVPSSADAPSFDNTFAVSFLAYLHADAETRREWSRRRSQAARLARFGQVSAADERVTAVTDAVSRRVESAADRVAVGLESAGRAAFDRAEAAESRIDAQVAPRLNLAAKRLAGHRAEAADRARHRAE